MDFTVINNTQNVPTGVNKRGTLVVADDAPVIRTIIKNSLPDFNIVEATNGDEAIQRLEERNYNVDGMFLDLLMPVSDGFKVLEEMKQKGVFVPTTVISGDDSVDTVQRVCNNYPNTDYVSKPLRRDKIQEAADRMQRTKNAYIQPQSNTVYSNEVVEESNSYQRAA